MMLAEMPAGAAMPAGTEDEKQDSARAADAPENADQQPEQASEQGESDQSPGSGEPSAAAAGMEEVEHDGKTYKIPKALKGALLMQADYTRKTQELAEQRRQHEEQTRQFAERQKLESEFLTDAGRIAACDETLAQLDRVDWSATWNNNRELYHQLQFQLQQTREAKQKAIDALQQKVNQRNANLQQESVRQLEQFRGAVQRDIPEWNPELAGRLSTYGMTLGFTADELGQVRDPRLVKVLHAAFQGSELRKQQAAARAAQATQAAKPLPTVAGNAGQTVRPSDPGSDRLSTEEWARRRNEQLRKQRAR